jgi:hypothetical protein
MPKQRSIAEDITRIEREREIEILSKVVSELSLVKDEAKAAQETIGNLRGLSGRITNAVVAQEYDRRRFDHNSELNMAREAYIKAFSTVEKIVNQLKSHVTSHKK